MRTPSYPRRLGLALAAATLIVGLAPVLGKVRDVLLDTFGVRFLALLAIGLMVAGIGAFGAAVLRIRDDRTRRYGQLAAAAALVGLQVWWWESGDQRVDLVERVHLLEYGGLALLFHRAFELRHRGFVRIPLTLLATGTVGVADELIQWWSPIRTGDQRDVWLNLFAATIGLLVARALAPREMRVGERTTGAPAWALGALFLASLGALVEAAHLGHGAGNDEIRFRSFFPAERLPELAAERAQSWASEPPELSAYGREDFFLTEAGWHVQARNAAWDAGDWTGAWVENRILELWYSPFLDLQSFRTGVVHRWPDEQRAHAEAGRARPLPGFPAPYWSPVLADRVVIDPWAGRLRWCFGIAFGVACAGWLVSRRRVLRS